MELIPTLTQKFPSENDRIRADWQCRTAGILNTVLREAINRRLPREINLGWGMSLG
jgi:hypothetical protein